MKLKFFIFYSNLRTIIFNIIEWYFKILQYTNIVNNCDVISYVNFFRIVLPENHYHINDNNSRNSPNYTFEQLKKTNMLYIDIICNSIRANWC